MKDSAAPVFAAIGSFLAVAIVAGHVIILLALTGVASGAAPRLGPAKVQCNLFEQSAVHYHVAVRLRVEEQTMALPTRTGIKPSCLYWVHTHDRSGIVHIEAPAEHAHDVFHLADLFGVWRRPLDSSQVGDHKLASDEKLKVYLDGSAWDGAPGDVPMAEHRTIDIVVSRGAAFTYQAFEWPDGF